MESLTNAATADLLVKIGWNAGAFLLAGAMGVIGTLLWGRGGRKRLLERITALEAQTRLPAITQTINFSGGTADDPERQLRTALDAETAQGLRETIRRLPQKPLGDGHTYAALPDGTNIVSMADGSYRLALPVSVSGLGVALALSEPVPHLSRVPSDRENRGGGDGTP